MRHIWSFGGKKLIFNWNKTVVLTTFRWQCFPCLQTQNYGGAASTFKSSENLTTEISYEIPVASQFWLFMRSECIECNLDILTKFNQVKMKFFWLKYSFGHESFLLLWRSVFVSPTDIWISSEALLTMNSIVQQFVFYSLEKYCTTSFWNQGW